MGIQRNILYEETNINNWEKFQINTEYEVNFEIQNIPIYFTILKTFKSQTSKWSQNQLQLVLISELPTHVSACFNMERWKSSQTTKETEQLHRTLHLLTMKDLLVMLLKTKLP